MENIKISVKEFTLNNVYFNEDILKALFYLQSSSMFLRETEENPIYDNEGLNYLLEQLTIGTDYVFRQWSEKVGEKDKELTEALESLGEVKTALKWLLIPKERLTDVREMHKILN